MAKQSDGPKGQPQFTTGAAPELGVDENLIADYAALVGNHKVGTQAERLALSGVNVWDGLTFEDSTDGCTYKRVSGAWEILASPAFGLARRTTTALVSGNSAYADISADAAWSTELDGGVTYSNGFVVPVAGIYLVEWSLQPSVGSGGIAGIAVDPAVPNGALLHAPGIISNGGAVYGSASAMVRLAAGAKVKLWCYGNGGALTISNTANQPATHWGVRWVAP